MKDVKVTEKIQDAEYLLREIKDDFRAGYVGAARRKSEVLSSLAMEIASAINEATSQ